MLQNHGVTVTEEDARTRYNRVLQACFVRTHVDLHLQVDDDEDEDEAGTDNNEDGTGVDNDEVEAGADDYDYEAAADSQEEDGFAMVESLFVEADEDEGDTAVEAEAHNDDEDSIKSEDETYLAESDQMFEEWGRLPVSHESRGKRHWIAGERSSV